jgi:ABC-type antimicrobial peptide transport system permease subunit
LKIAYTDVLVIGGGLAGLRVALGARPATVVALMVRQAMIWTLTGLLIGLGLALLVSRLLGGLLYGISPTDPLTFGLVILLLGSVAGIAALVPAVRASRLDPLTALRTL